MPRKPRLVPARPPDTRPFEGEQGEPLSKVETVELSPQQALDRLRAQMAQIAEEYAAGRLNRAQFYAIYSRYNEQRAVTEGLMARDPHSTAWQQVVRPGHTAFLRQHFEARILSFAIYDLGQTTPIVRHGTVHPRLGEVDPILSALPGFMRRKKQALGPARKAVSGGHWLVVVPGQYTVTMVLFSLEPSAQQITQIADLAGDFERANLRALARGDRDPARLVFPQRALFEKSSS